MWIAGMTARQLRSHLSSSSSESSPSAILSRTALHRITRFLTFVARSWTYSGESLTILPVTPFLRAESFPQICTPRRVGARGTKLPTSQGVGAFPEVSLQRVVRGKFALRPSFETRGRRFESHHSDRFPRCSFQPRRSAWIAEAFSERLLLSLYRWRGGAISPGRLPFRPPNSAYSGLKFIATPLMQYRRCVGGGPSGKM